MLRHRRAGSVAGMNGELEERGSPSAEEPLPSPVPREQERRVWKGHGPGKNVFLYRDMADLQWCASFSVLVTPFCPTHCDPMGCSPPSVSLSYAAVSQ